MEAVVLLGMVDFRQPETVVLLVQLDQQTAVAAEVPVMEAMVVTVVTLMHLQLAVMVELAELVAQPQVAALQAAV
jgi:hypothetical protein